MVQENTMKLHEGEMAHSNFEKEEGVIRYELDGLRNSSE